MERLQRAPACVLYESDQAPCAGRPGQILCARERHVFQPPGTPQMLHDAIVVQGRAAVLACPHLRGLAIDVLRQPDMRRVTP